MSDATTERAIITRGRVIIITAFHGGSFDEFHDQQAEQQGEEEERQVIVVIGSLHYGCNRRR